MMTGRFGRALSFACKLHEGQKRKGTEIPYISHPLAVAALVLENGGSEDAAIAALLHDAVEDRGGAGLRGSISRRFGAKVADIVSCCSDCDTFPKPPWRERKERYISQLAAAPPEAKLVAAADKLHNARAILADYRILGETLWLRFNAGRDEQLWYFRSVMAALHEGGPEALVDELERVVDEIEKIMRLTI